MWTYLEIKPGVMIQIDDRDRDRVARQSWRTHGEATYGFVIQTGAPGRGPTQTLARFILECRIGQEASLKDPSKFLDYRRDNLILETRRQRQQRLPKTHTQTTSRFKGVSWNKQTEKWRSSICVSGHSVNLGEFLSEEQAAVAYNKAALKFFGEEAFINQLPDETCSSGSSGKN